MKNKTVNLGFDNVVMLDRIIAVTSAEAAPVKRLIREARKLNKLVDATAGRKTRAVIVSDSDHVILSSAQSDTITQRINESGLQNIDKSLTRILVPRGASRRKA